MYNRNIEKNNPQNKKIESRGNTMEKILYCIYNNFGRDAIMFIKRKTLNNGAEIYSSDNTKVTARIEKVNNVYVATAYRNCDEYDFLGEQSKTFKTLLDARKAVENGFIKWRNY